MTTRVVLAIFSICFLGLDFTFAGPVNETKAAEPSPRFDYGGHTYYIRASAVDWFGARNLCREDGLDLASIQNSAENSAILSAISAYSESFWVSGSDQWQEGNWYWDSTGVDFGSNPFWSPNQPNNSGNCLRLWNDVGHLWDDEDCVSKHAYICETQISLCT